VTAAVPDVVAAMIRAAEYAARLGVTPIDLDSDHGPMLSHIDELVQVLEKI